LDWSPLGLEFFMAKKEVFDKHTETLPPTFAEKDLSYYLRTLKGDFSEMAEVQSLKVMPSASHKNIIILATSKGLGPDEKLGAVLMQKFLNSLILTKIKPKAIILMNDGIELAKTDSACLSSLTTLIEQEVSVLICDTSVKEKKLEKEIRIGNTVNMNVICENLLSAWKVITL